MTLRRLNPLIGFALFALIVNASLTILLRYNHRPVVAAASCVDLLVSLPAIYYFAVIRAGAQPLITIIPVLLGGLFRVSYLVPFSGVSRSLVAGVCEVGLVWFLVRQGEQSLAARVLLSELSVFQYAFASWRKKPDVPPGGRAFSMHKTGGVALMFGLFAGISIVEAGCAHLVIQRWSPAAAWIVFGLSIYGGVFLVALARSFNLRPIVVMPHSIWIRSGLIWQVEIAPQNIARIDASGHAARYLRVTGMCEPNVFLELGESVIAEGLYGRRKRVSRIAISADEPQEFLRAIRSVV